MSKCDLQIRLEKDDRIFRTGEIVRGHVRVTPHENVECRGLKLTAGWRTHGRGNSDSSPSPVVKQLFQGRWSAGLPQEYPFEFPAPAGPATYHGQLINVDHYIRAEADIPWAGDPTAEAEILIPAGDAAVYDFGPGRQMSAMSSPHAMATLQRQRPGQAVQAAVFVIGLAAMASFFFYGAWTLLGIVPLLAGVVLYATAKRKVAESRLGTPLVRLAPDPARAGEEITVSLSFEPRADVVLKGGRVALSAYERAVSGSGTNRTTHTHQLHASQHELPLTGRTVGAGHPIALQQKVALPSDAAPTFRAEDNDVSWAVLLHVEIEGWPDWETEIPLAVRPR